MYLQAQQVFIVRETGQRTGFNGKQVLRRGGIHEQFDEIQGHAPELASSSPGQILQRNYKISGFRYRGRYSWL
jgi:hypothetical protein